MWGYIEVKNVLKYAAGCSAAAAASLGGAAAGRSGCILNYHRVAEVGGTHSRADAWNVAPGTFERHARWLAREAECVPLATLLERVRAGGSPRPLVALSFDDGYGNFRHNVLPILQRYGLPATVFVVTRYVGTVWAFPFDSWGQTAGAARPLATKPISWTELEECIETGLVSVGSHSHRHMAACDCTEAELLEEACVSCACIRGKLGAEQGNVYAYPYGFSRAGQVPPAYVSAVRQAGCRMALTTDLGMVQPGTPQYLVPRVEAHAWDTPAMLRGKANGYLFAFRLLQGLRGDRHFRDVRLSND